ncbi:hypothetical protein [Paenibacillus harenae]|uniref:hypothetical protein n=1 Tax=Paenibacillus harenae TaxID=306543 RepID=UPI00278DE3B9|nr:hypothetical protein [Paenibacillus harenae]MDQ0062751.1 hypothetical protein [Paenibacillus harenae]
MLTTLLLVFIFIMIGWGVISSMTAPKTDHKLRRRGRDGGSPAEYSESGNSDGGCDGGGGGGD